MTDPAPNHKRRAIRVQILNANGQKVLNGTLWDETKRKDRKHDGNSYPGTCLQDQ